MTRWVTPLKRILLDEGRRQTWLSERSGVEVTRLSRIVNGLHPTEHEAAAIAGVLGRHVDEVFPQTEPARDAA